MLIRDIIITQLLETSQFIITDNLVQVGIRNSDIIPNIFKHRQSSLGILLVLVTGSVAKEISVRSQSIVLLEIFNHYGVS